MALVGKYDLQKPVIHVPDNIRELKCDALKKFAMHQILKWFFQELCNQLMFLCFQNTKEANVRSLHTNDLG